MDVGTRELAQEQAFASATEDFPRRFHEAESRRNDFVTAGELERQERFQALIQAFTDKERQDKKSSSSR